jgi:3'-phosphoadenosine 5'-phosphosulfate (PAPS) 3'-phosphatase
MNSAFDASAINARVEVAIGVARKVGQEAARFRSETDPGALHVENKGLQDFVTVADRRAEQAIREGLLSRFPDDTFMGEESGGQSGAAGTWVVDPIDGTTNYIRGFRHWGVSIAFVLGDQVEIGVVYDATQDKVFSAVRGGGAFKEGVAIHAAASISPCRGGFTSAAWIIAAWEPPRSISSASRRGPPISITSATSTRGTCWPVPGSPKRRAQRWRCRNSPLSLHRAAR